MAWDDAIPSGFLGFVTGVRDPILDAQEKITGQVIGPVALVGMVEWLGPTRSWITRIFGAERERRIVWKSEPVAVDPRDLGEGSAHVKASTQLMDQASRVANHLQQLYATTRRVPSAIP